ncbi:MAG: hypothetical protein RMJ83_02690 [Armatimonadota bacterium]|nr:hypothetical protein [Armatimonadota bacterium]
MPHDRPFTLIGSAAGYSSVQVTNVWPPLNGEVWVNLRLPPSWGGLLMGRRLHGRVQLDGYFGDPQQVWLTVEAYQHNALVWRQDVHPNADGSFAVDCPLRETVDLRLKADRWISTWVRNVDLNTTTERHTLRASLRPFHGRHREQRERASGKRR